MNAAISGVRTVQNTYNLPRIPIALSIDKGDLDGQPQSFYANIQSSSLGNVTDFDVEGVDFYPSSTDLISTMQSNLTTLAGTNETAFTKAGNTLPQKRIMVLETNYPWENGGSTTYAGWTYSPAGQQAEFSAVRNLVQGLPYNDGEGACTGIRRRCKRADSTFTTAGRPRYSMPPVATTPWPQPAYLPPSAAILMAMVISMPPTSP